MTELVANAWDAGASKVEIVIPKKIGKALIVKDDGSGMTQKQFYERWMTLGYDRVAHQGQLAEFPPDRNTKARRYAYGRNGVGRHGMLCFAPDYEVETKRDGFTSHFHIITTAKKDPFAIAKETIKKGTGHGTLLTTTVDRNLPSVEKIKDIILARFLHDPSFVVTVNGVLVPLEDHKGLVQQKTLRVNDSCSIKVVIIDSTKAGRTTQYQGVAFWVGKRLVGEPTWVLGSESVIDGRTQIAKRYTVVVESDDLFDEVLPDWSGFRKSPLVKTVYARVADHVLEVFASLSTQRLQETTENVFRQHKSEIKTLGPLARRDLSFFVQDIVTRDPIIQTPALTAAVRAAITMQQSRSGAALLEKLSKLPESDIEGLNKLLGEWSVRDALTVLEEIDDRLATVHSIESWSRNPATDELHTLHPLVLKARWLFGPEFDSPEYISNETLLSAVRKILGNPGVPPDVFTNARRRPDIIVMDDRTIAGYECDELEYRKPLIKPKHILLIELKRGGAELTADHVAQAMNYVSELYHSSVLGEPTITAFVVGHRIGPKVDRLDVGEFGAVEPTTFATLVRTAEKRLFNLRNRLSKYENMPETELMERVLTEPEQQATGL